MRLKLSLCFMPRIIAFLMPESSSTNHQLPKIICENESQQELLAHGARGANDICWDCFKSSLGPLCTDCNTGIVRTTYQRLITVHVSYMTIRYIQYSSVVSFSCLLFLQAPTSSHSWLFLGKPYQHCHPYKLGAIERWCRQPYSCISYFSSS